MIRSECSTTIAYICNVKTVSNLNGLLGGIKLWEEKGRTEQTDHATKR